VANSDMAADANGSAEKEQPAGKLKLSDKIWVAAVIAVFVVAFILIVIYDVI
jgi:hypothetical protein